ncbi:M48 family metallopeptidase [Ramlibacter cellulosilyticus]|uniref:M48 family metallopeptidase n=1 Tax=Ramlibacter cellulosilyticus TaxID=2764187 RepID=UPI0021073DCE|nr:M48 family metallopeptidase [Ramlibacter cellulosilyticus]
MAAALPGLWFDGRTSGARPVEVRLQRAAEGPSLALQAEDGESLVLRHRQVRWPERWSAKRAPRKVVVDLGARGSLEISDPAAWEQALGAAGYQATVATRMQTRWTTFAVVLLAVVAVVLAFYRWGTPWVATQLTRQVPLSWETDLTQRALRDIDGEWLKPSKLPAQRQAALRARFDALAANLPAELRRYPGYQPKLELHFRHGMGANAFALPGGTVVMTDGIVELADKHQLGDEALVGVLAHEIGHVLHRHATRLVVEQGVLNVGLGLALGDVSWLASIGGSMLTGLSYRRSHESEADCFAVALMARTGGRTAPMADLLMKMDHGAKAGESAGWTELLSSHPATPQRAEALKRGESACR